MRKEKLEEIRRSRERSLIEEKSHYSKLAYKPTKGDLSTLRDPKIVEEELTFEQRRKNIDKGNSYSKYVKEMYWPKISESKRIELEQIKGAIGSQKLRRSVINLKTTNNNSKL